jgi:hypothetical protein
MASTQNSALRLPQQDLDRCSLFEVDHQSLSNWADQLPMGSPARAGAAIREALEELNRVALPPSLRFGLLEILRAPTHSVVTALIQSCLNQPIILDENLQVQADLVADLCRLSSVGYTLVAVHTVRGDDDAEGVNAARLACEGLHRAVVQTGVRILNNCLLYQHMPLQCWKGLHQLYALAERQQLARLPVDDPLREAQSSIVQEYLPPLLLACSKPNQLRQHDIAGAYRAFQEWRNLAELQDPEFGEGLFAVDMNSDQGPVFAELLVRRGATQFRYINTKTLVGHLEELKHSRGTQGLRVIEFDRHTRLDANLLEHLIKSLGEISQRNFARQTSRVGLHIAAGISNVHYYVAGERGLLQVIHGDGYTPTVEEAVGNPFLGVVSNDDQWSESQPETDSPQVSDDNPSAVPVNAADLDRAADAQEQRAGNPIRHIVHSVKTTNSSPSGYCVEWEEPPEGIHIGDIVCVRDADYDQGEWTIAVIRWVSQVKDAPTLLGLELLSPRGSAYAAQVKMADGELSRPIRVLLLPEIPLVAQTHTLVVPRMVFREGQRITLSREHDAFLVKLKRQVASTGYFSQMDFEYIRQLDDDTDGRGNRKNATLSTNSFESVWNDI